MKIQIRLPSDLALAIRRAAPIVFVSLLFASCGGTVHSSELLTHGVFPTYTIEEAGARARVATAQFRVANGSGALVILDGADAFFLDGKPIDQSASDQRFSTTVPATQASSVFEFVRPGERDPVKVSSPTRFLLTSPPLEGDANLRTPRPGGTSGPDTSTAFTLTWDRIVPSATVTISTKSPVASCGGNTLAAQVPDTGSYAFRASSFASANSPTGDCLYDVAVARDEVVAIGAPFAGGTATSRHVEGTTLTLHRLRASP
jgi:type II secretory pathway pseudopilin PulG